MCSQEIAGKTEVISQMVNPYVFIVGCPRSGTTLFRHMVDAHPQIAITPEAHWLPRFFEERRGLTPEGIVTPDLIQQLLEHPKFGNFHIQPQDLLGLIGKERPTSYASLITGIFDLYGHAQGKALVGNKTPDSVRKLRTLHTLWPETRFVHLIRDGRDVALSFMKWPKVLQKKPGNFSTWKDDPFSTAALWWELNVRCGLRAFEWLDPKLCHEMRYESLIANPRKECAALCEFLKLPYDESMLRFHERREESPSGDTMNPAWQPITAGLRNWRTQTSEENVERFEAVAGELLDELGYARAFPHPRAEILEGASRIRNLIAQDLHDLTLAKAPNDVREAIKR
jgi:hypothetical protein